MRIGILVVFYCLIGFLAGSTAISAQAQASPPLLTVDQQSQVANLVSRLMGHASSVGCKPLTCKILVADFTDPSGNTSNLGMELANQFASQLRASTKGIEIIPRIYLRVFLDHERIPSTLLVDHRASRWLGMQFAANALIVGEYKKQNDLIRLKVRMLDCKPIESGEMMTRGVKESEAEEEIFAGIGTTRNMAVVEGYAPPPNFRDVLRKTDPHINLFLPDKNSNALPTCKLADDSPYLQEALAAEFQGNLKFDVVLGPDEKIKDFQIRSGLPFGLNQSAIANVSRWKCTLSKRTPPGTYVVFPIEFSFQRYR